jgi:hypothetical protein
MFKPYHLDSCLGDPITLLAISKFIYVTAALRVYPEKKKANTEFLSNDGKFFTLLLC